jgi:hypothetical protein
MLTQTYGTMAGTIRARKYLCNRKSSFLESFCDGRGHACIHRRGAEGTEGDGGSLLKSMTSVPLDVRTRATIALEADEFLRRYLLHVLPERFVRIRYFGFLANRVRSRNLTLAREQLGPLKTQSDAPAPEQDASPPKCSSCGIGSMIVIERVAPQDVPVIDSS